MSFIKLDSYHRVYGRDWGWVDPVLIDNVEVRIGDLTSVLKAQSSKWWTTDKPMM